MALDACITIKGAKQGQFPGGNNIKSRANTSVVVRTEALVNTPRDVSSGLALGKRMYDPLKLELLFDPAYIMTMTAAATNEILSTVLISYFQPAGSALQNQGATKQAGGEAKAFYTIELTNAQISSCKFTQPYSRAHESSEDKHRDNHYEIELTFQKITCTWVEGGKTFTDDWTVGV